MSAVEVSSGRLLFLNIAMWITIVGVLCAVAAGVLTIVGGMETAVRPVAFAAMICAVVAVAGAVMHTASGVKAIYGILAVAMFIAGSSLFGLTFPQ